MLATISAAIFSALIGIVILFQLALALGAPWGEYSMGGKFKGRYPPKMRAVAIMNAAVLAFIAIIALARAELIWPCLYSFSKTAIWVVVGFSVLSVFLNTATKSVWERRIWLPVALGMLITSFITAIG